MTAGLFDVNTLPAPPATLPLGRYYARNHIRVVHADAINYVEDWYAITDACWVFQRRVLTAKLAPDYEESETKTLLGEERP